MNNRRIRSIIREELNKSDVRSVVSNEIDSMYSSRDFKKAVKTITTDVIKDLFKILWQKDNMWSSTLKNG